jgi:hypothetical protein
VRAAPAQGSSSTQVASGRRGRGFKSRHPDSEVPGQGLIHLVDQALTGFRGSSAPARGPSKRLDPRPRPAMPSRHTLTRCPIRPGRRSFCRGQRLSGVWGGDEPGACRRRRTAPVTADRPRRGRDRWGSGHGVTDAGEPSSCHVDTPSPRTLTGSTAQGMALRCTGVAVLASPARERRHDQT